MVRGSNPSQGGCHEKWDQRWSDGDPLNSRRVLNLHPPYSMQSKPSKSREVQCSRSPMPTGREEGADKKRCVPTPRRMGARPMAVGTWWMDYPMATGIQWTRIRQMAVSVRCLGDNPETKIADPYQQKQKNAADRDQTDGCRHSTDNLRFDG